MGGNNSEGKISIQFFFEIEWSQKRAYAILAFFLLFNFKIKLKDNILCICHYRPPGGAPELFQSALAECSSLPRAL